MLNFLFSIFVVFNSHPVPKASIACVEVNTYTTESGEPGTVISGGEMQPTDSRGRMIFEGPPQEYHCQAWKDGVGFWSGSINFNKSYTSETVDLADNPYYYEAEE